MYLTRVNVAILARSSRNLSIGRDIRGLRTTTRVFLDAAPGKTKGQAPCASRDPEEHTLLEQNPHLKHAKSSRGGKEGRDVGKGNAAPEPELPSHKFSSSPGKSPSRGGKGIGGKRKLHTSVVVREEGGGGAGSGHTAESYFKEVDGNPPASNKTFRVDGTSEATHRPHQQWADPQEEYATVSKDEPYEPPVETNNGEKSEQKDQKLRYGSTNRDAMRNAPGGDEGPQAKDAGGLKRGGQVRP